MAHQQSREGCQARTALSTRYTFRKVSHGRDSAACASTSVLLVFDHGRMDGWYFPYLVAVRRAIVCLNWTTATTAGFWNAGNHCSTLLARDQLSEVPLVAFLTAPLTRAPWVALTPGFGVGVLGAGWKGRIARSQTLDLICQGLNLLLEISDPLLVASNKSLDESTCRLGLGGKLDSTIWRGHPTIWPENACLRPNQFGRVLIPGCERLQLAATGI